MLWIGEHPAKMLGQVYGTLASNPCQNLCLANYSQRANLRKVSHMSDQSLFDKYGGFSNISKVVMTFYDAVLDSDEIGPFFDDVDMSRMVDHQTKFIASLLGGPAAYTDGQLRNMHARLEITHEHFDELLVILRAALVKHGVDTAELKDPNVRMLMA